MFRLSYLNSVDCVNTVSILFVYSREKTHFAIVAVIIDVRLLFRRRAATALGWFKLKGHDPFRLSVRGEW